MTVTDTVSIQLNNIDRWEDLILKQVVELQVGAEGGPLRVEGDVPYIGDVAVAYDFLQSTEITDERTSVGGWHMVQEPGECREYFE